MALTKILQEGIKDGEIVNADINASAAIATSKISGLATSATTDTTNASNIASGSLANARLTKPIDLADNEQIRLGTGNDLLIFHDGTNSSVQNGTGTLRLRGDSIKLNNNGASENYLVATANGSVELYYDNSKMLQTTANGIEITGSNSIFLGGKIDMTDSSSTSTGRILLGTGDDLQIYHDGSNSYINNATGFLNIKTSNGGANYIDADDQFFRTSGGEDLVKMIGDGSVELYYDNVKKFHTASIGCQVTGNLFIAGGYINLNDNYSYGMGSGNRAQLYHSGSHQFLLNTVGNMYFQPKSGENGIVINPDGAVELYHDNSKKLETDSFGINVTGNSSTTAQIKIHSQPAIGRSYWGYGGNQTYTGTSIGRTDSSTASSIFMGVDVTGNAGGNFGGLGSEIVFRRDHIFTTPNAANNNFVTCMRFGRATSTEGAVAFTNGLMFGNDQADANILDDYEEGSGTVSVYSNPNVVINSTYNQADYTKVGNMVTVTMLLQINSVSSTNYFRINMPFTNVNHGNPRRSDAIGVVMHNGVNTGDAGVVGYLPMGSSVISFYKVSDNTSWSILTNSDLATNDEMYLTITYKTA